MFGTRYHPEESELERARGEKAGERVAARGPRWAAAATRGVQAAGTCGRASAPVIVDPDKNNAPPPTVPPTIYPTVLSLRFSSNVVSVVLEVLRVAVGGLVSADRESFSF